MNTTIMGKDLWIVWFGTSYKMPKPTWHAYKSDVGFMGRCAGDWAREFVDGLLAKKYTNEAFVLVAPNRTQAINLAKKDKELIMGSQDYSADIKDLELKRDTTGLTEDEKRELIWLREQVAKGYINPRE